MEGSHELNPNDFPDEIHFTAHKEGEGKAFSSGEHRDIGNIAYILFAESLKAKGPDAAEFLKLLDTVTYSAGETVKIFNPFVGKDGQIEEKAPTLIDINPYYRLTPGHIVALAGDFIGIPEEPIAFGKFPAGQESLFEQAFNKMIEADAAQAAMYKDIAKKFESANVPGAVHSCLHSADWKWIFKKVKNEAKDAIKSNVVVETLSYQIAMMPTVKIMDKPSAFFHADYIQLLLRNFDHFGEEAKQAYLAGHRVAIRTALDAREKKSAELLKKAMMMELFACHFLTDLFAGGHIRTPRKELFNDLTSQMRDLGRTPDIKASTLNLAIAGFFANRMHDEDGEEGVYVDFPGKNEPWQAFGDGNYYSKGNVINARNACVTMLKGLEDLFLVFSGKQEVLKDISVLNQFVPRPVAHPKQIDPMFFVKDGRMHCRIDIDLLTQIKKKGLIEGSVDTVKDGVPFAFKYLGYIATKHFNVTLIPAAEHAKDKVIAVVEDAGAKLQEVIDKCVSYESQVSCTIC